jgi:glutamyl/glutaminyl-tRNA synthetase
MFPTIKKGGDNHNLNKDDLKTVIENANNIFEEITNKYNLTKKKDYDEYLMFSSPYGQCEITSSMRTIAEEFPEMVHDSIHKKEACELVQDIRKLREEIARTFVRKAKDDLKKKMDDYEKRLAQIAENFEVMEDTFVEIRFNALNYNIIDELRKDPIISLKHTPQTKASIRIVLGTLDELKRVINGKDNKIVYNEK